MTKQIPLTGRRGNGKYALVDDDDFDELSQYTWNFHHKKGRITGYARRHLTLPTGRQVGRLMHLEILDAPSDVQVDHINGDGLDNRKENLRPATGQENQMNRQSFRGRSRYKGVVWQKSCSRWVANIGVGKKTLHLGTFLTQRDAAIAYNQAAVQHFGEFARLNPIPAELPAWDKPLIPHTPTSPYTGVYWHNQTRKWRAGIYSSGKQIHLGTFTEEQEAAKAYDTYVTAHNLNRPLNFPH